MSTWFNIYVFGNVGDFEGCEMCLGGWYWVFRGNVKEEALAYFQKMVLEYGEDLVYFEEE